MADARSSITEIYIAAFNRVPDASGLSYWVNAYNNGATLNQISQAFTSSPEYTVTYPSFLTNTEYVTKIYQNVFNRTPDSGGLAFWVNTLNTGALTWGTLMNTMVQSTHNDPANTDGIRLTNESTFGVYCAMNNLNPATASGQLANITTDPATVTAAQNAVIGGSGTTYSLTTGVDTIPGTAYNDTINGTLGGTSPTLNAFDSINGAAGTNTLNLSDSTAAAFALPAATFANIQTVNLNRAAASAATSIGVTVTNTTFGTGVQTLNVTESGAATTAAAAAVTLNSATAVSVVDTQATLFTTVGITDTSTTAASTGSTLATATVTGTTGAVTLTGNGITTVNLNNIGALTTVTAAAGTRALTVNANGTAAITGLTDATATSATLNLNGATAFGTLTTAKATSVAINTTKASSETIAAAAATSLTLDGTQLNTLTVTGTDPITTITVKGSGGVSSNVSGIGTLTTLDTTASTAAAPASGTATGANTFTIGTGVTYNGGAGQDVVTVGATTKAITLGAGNDTANITVTALGSGGSVNGGDGTNVLKLANADAVTLSTAGAAQAAFKAAVTNFQTLDITTQTGSTIDVSKMGTFSQVNMVSASAAQVLSGITTGMTIQDTYSAAGTSITTNALTSGTDTLTFVMKGDLSTAARAFGTLATPGVETVNLQLSDTTPTVTVNANTLTLTDANLQHLVISGNNGLTLTNTATTLFDVDASGMTKGAFVWTSGVLATDTTVKGSAAGGDTLNLSAATAKVTITETAGTNTLTGSATVANTITGGSGADTITGGSAADTIVVGTGTTVNSVSGLGGADSINLTGATGADTIIYTTNALGASAAGANIVTINNFVSGIDKIQLQISAGTAGTSTYGVAGAGATVGTMNAVITDATSVADISAVYTALGTDLSATTFLASAAAASGIVARAVTFANGAAAGTYVVVNDGANGFQGATDVVFKLVGTTTIAAGDFSYSAVA